MKKIILKYTLFIIVVLNITGCNKDEVEPYDQPFIHIMKDDVSSVTVKSKATVISGYNVYLSSKRIEENLVVEYSLIVGDGLVEGIDYELITKTNSLTFLPGIFDMPIRIKWLPNNLDENKNNSIVIRLESNNLNYTIGLPGDKHEQREFTITKVN